MSNNRCFFFQGKRGVFEDRSIGLASALIATTVVLFVISAENPRSIKGPTFLFVMTISIICPTIFILGSKKMRQSITSSVILKVVESTDKTKTGFRRIFQRNRVGVQPKIDKDIELNKC